MQYAIIHNTSSNALIALPSTEVLNDIAFDKGWRVLQQDCSYTELQKWKENFNIEVMDSVRFYLDYLVEEEMTEEDTAYIEACMQENFYEEVHADGDEEIDHEFHFMEAPLCDDVEYNQEA